MTSLQLLSERSATAHVSTGAHYSLYSRLLRGQVDAERDNVRDFLQDQLEMAKTLPSNLPADLNDLSSWVASNSHSVAEQYGVYLQERRAGGPRKFFTNKAHALYFLQSVAPSKLVDGAWLYGTVRHANDWRYHGLIRTYLEELGDGEPALNHVVLYRNLLTEHDCAPIAPLDDALYLQGAIQLGLGHLSDEFLPEILGYNLGYEQLPLHLLITSFELSELGIDPYYFTLHVTIDNASSGHAHKAVEAVLDLLPNDDSKGAFLQRLRAGYLLNDLGIGSTDIVRAFDLEEEVVSMLETKSTFGQHMHSDYCRLEGRTINDWLATPGQSRQLLSALEDRGWIKRNQDPQDSRFWQLIDGPGAVMFGVFSGYEMQLLKDWIAGDWQASEPGNPFRTRFRRRPVAATDIAQPRNVPALSFEKLVELIAPDSHPTPEGLAATRIYARQLAQGSLTR
ncbi:heme oxygenase-like protein [Pseudomonas graminis]|uniref:iron-containing redox enzyme family protein n=1 Tax=Pseudomonas graminis TaxID=158627 RepID=UPI0010613905|nr:iron-containing redox enzyme family protein [Pseudomonas graminis]TDV58265.1 heme oxygenase-like protein [Pseudomonas graminis]